MAMDDAKPDNKLPNRRPLLIGVVVVRNPIAES